MRRGVPTGPATAELYRQVLEAVAEAIDLPMAADRGYDDEVREEILGQRADRAAHAIRTVLRNGDDAAIVSGAITMLKQNLGGNPYKDQYRTWVEEHGSHPLESAR